ncbi:MAG: glutamine--fructose-6-phosphate transaminase (isomerizing) [Rickettsiaceae bacterium H1]|nr:glutamine--fructose-6-phosphate transaminase (isomerizing) [Rickettsiaceae bacterium H1]
MCGIIGVISKQLVAEMLLNGLSALEYRGYDSSGIAVINGKISYCKVKGKVAELKKEVNKKNINGNIGIGHTRWATHGIPSVTNAHPHVTDKVALVHNGIIENVAELKNLLKDHYDTLCNTDTDSEIIALLITVYLSKSFSPLDSIYKVMGLLKGSFTFVALLKDDKAIIAVKKGSTLFLGHGKDNDIIVCSDSRVLSSFTNSITFLEDYDVAYIKNEKCFIYDKNRSLIKWDMLNIPMDCVKIEKIGNYPNFMLKEIFDQPQAIINTVNNFHKNNEIVIPKIKRDEVTIVACGSSYFAALIGKYWLELIGGLSVKLEIASEFIYQNCKSGKTMLFISQSGETADILVGLQHAKSQKNYIIGLTNTKGSSLTRISDEVLYTEAGNEIGVASTKTFTSQLIALQCLSIGQKENVNSEQYLSDINLLAKHIMNFFENHNVIYQAVDLILQAKNILYIGRGTSYGLAMEGALKLKELSYLPAEGIAAGELKHGTLALIDDWVITVVIIPHDNLFFKTLSNIQEIVARGGKVIALSDAKGEKLLSEICELVITMPTFAGFYLPILYTIPIQLISYYTALKVGSNVDQPRNLAKSVTVE